MHPWWFLSLYIQTLQRIFVFYAYTHYQMTFFSVPHKWWSSGVFTSASPNRTVIWHRRFPGFTSQCVDIPSLHPAGSVCHYGISQRVIHNLHGERSHCRSHTCSPQCSCLHCSASLQTITASCLSRTRQTCMLQFTYIHFQSKVLDLYKMFNVFKRSLFCLLLITITI